MLIFVENRNGNRDVVGINGISTNNLMDEGKKMHSFDNHVQSLLNGAFHYGTHSQGDLVGLEAEASYKLFPGSVSYTHLTLPTILLV